MKENAINKNKDVIIMLLLSFGLVIPSFIQSLVNFENKQLIIGTILNAMLFTCSLYVKDTKKIIALSTLPSISNILTGILFSGLTYYSKLMLPFIWIGNLLLIYLTRKLKENMNSIFSYAVSIMAKVTVIYLGFRLLSIIFKFPNVVFNLMNVSMGITQVYTSCLGLLLFILANGIMKKLKC